MRRLRAGVIGLGVGEQHIAGYKRHPNCEVRALCDFSKKVLSLAKRKYPNCKITRHASDILKDPEIDVVSIASYDNYHYEQIVEAIKNNKHIFVEKPLCLHKKEATRIHYLLSEKPHLKLSSNLILRMSPRFRKLHNMIKKGILGKIFYVEGDYNYGRLYKITDGWRGKIDFYSIVYGGGVHMVDLLLWLTQDIIREVSAYGNKISSGDKFRYNDMVSCILKFNDGIVGKIAVNMGCVFPHFHGLSVYGTKGTFINGQKKAFFYKSRDPHKKPEEIDAAYPGIHKGDLISSFINSIVKDTRPEVTKEDVFRAMSVCFAIEEAVNKKRTVDVEYI